MVKDNMAGRLGAIAYSYPKPSVSPVIAILQLLVVGIILTA